MTGRAEGGVRPMTGRTEGGVRPVASRAESACVRWPTDLMEAHVR